MVASRFRRGGRDGRLPSIGHDYDRGHREYVSRLPPAGRLWLRTKPFSAPPNAELAPCFRTFAHLVEHLQLGVRAQVLDVGCGPGWLSEFLARCGYWVTGIDVSEDMVAIARERVAAIGGPVGEGLEAHAEFHALHVRELPWENRFDAAVLYDTLHHFDDELATLRVLHRTLVPGGRVYIREGVLPEPGSESERHLIEEMREWGTLEAPFEPAYLAAVLEQAGFVDVRRFVEVDELVDLSDPKPVLDLVKRYVRIRLGRALPATNTVTAVKPIALTGAADAFRARMVLAGPPALSDGQVRVTLSVENTGRAYWPVAAAFPYPNGIVTVAPYVLREGARVELTRAPLPRAVGPGDSVPVTIVVSREALGDADEMAVDLVREGIEWFSEPGSPLLRVSLAAP